MGPIKQGTVMLGVQDIGRRVPETVRESFCKEGISDQRAECEPAT